MFSASIIEFPGTVSSINIVDNNTPDLIQHPLLLILATSSNFDDMSVLSSGVCSDVIKSLFYLQEATVSINSRKNLVSDEHLCHTLTKVGTNSYLYHL